MTCGDRGRLANAQNLLTQCARFLLDENEAKSIISNMKEQVRAYWYSTLRAQSVSEHDVDKIKGAFVYDGFESK